MIALAQTPEQLQMLCTFLKLRSGTELTDEAHLIGWVSHGTLVIVVGIDGFIGRTAQIHVALAPDFHYLPRELVRWVFDHCFGHCERKVMVALVRHNNIASMKFCGRLGFVQSGRIECAYMDDSDMVIWTMRPHQCRYLRSEKKELAHAH